MIPWIVLSCSAPILLGYKVLSAQLLLFPGNNNNNDDSMYDEFIMDPIVPYLHFLIKFSKRPHKVDTSIIFTLYINTDTHSERLNDLPKDSEL